VRTSTQDAWRDAGRFLVHEISEAQAIHIDDLQEFERANALVQAGLVSFPWLRRDEQRR